MKTHDDLQALIDAAPDYHPPIEESDLLLKDDCPDTVANLFREMQKRISKEYLISDIYGILESTRDGKWQTITQGEIEHTVREFLGKCKILTRTKGMDGKAVTFPGTLPAKMKTPNFIKSIIVWLGTGETFLSPNQSLPFWRKYHAELPDPNKVIALSNCLISYGGFPDKSYQVLSHTTNFVTNNYLNVTFVDGAACPLWEKFLGQVFFTKKLCSSKMEFDERGNWVEGYEIISDNDSIQLLQEYMGLLLTIITKFQKILGIIGPKRSGKTTIGKICRKLIGITNVTTPTLSSLATEFGLFGLLYKTVAIIGDASINSRSRDVAVAVERLKMISGEDGMTVRRMYQSPLDIPKMPLRFIVMANEIQSLTDPTGALASRWLYLFTKKSFYGCEDLQLEEKLTDELSGIFLWSLEGLKRLIGRGHFAEPQESIEARMLTEELGSGVIAFARECLIFNENLNAQKTELWEKYKIWSENSGRSQLGKNRFYADFLAAFPDVFCSKTRLPETGTNPIFVFSGVGFNEEVTNLFQKTGTN